MRLVPAAYLASYLLSVLGNSIAAIALPLIVLQVTGSVLAAGTVAAATAVPAVLAGVLMGVVIDRVNRRTSSVVADVFSAASIAALPLVDMLAGLSVGWFVLFGVIGSIGDVPGMTAREALLPAVVRHSGTSAERLVGTREALGAVGLLVGPAAAGTLMVVLDGTAVLWVTAATSLSAALLTLLIPRHVGAIPVVPDPAEAPSTGWADLKHGWRALVRDRFLVATTAVSLVSVLALTAMQGIILPVHFTLAERPGMVGFVLSALAAGMLAGGAAYALAGTRGRRRTWFLLSLLGSAAGFVVIATLSSVPVVLGGACVVGISVGVLGSLIGVLLIERIPEEVRGRVMGTQNAMLTAVAPGGIVLAAVLVEHAGVDVAARAVAGVWLVAVLIGLRARSLRRLEPDQTTATGTAVAGGA